MYTRTPKNFIPEGTPLLFIEQTVWGQHTKATYKCLLCGSITEKNISLVKSGRLKSCGCLNVSSRFSNGLSAHPLYAIHTSILNRCYNEKCQTYRNYGSKGVTMCQEWKSNFMAFYNWCMENGWQKGMQIDKDIKSKLLGVVPCYSPETCSIVTRSENNKHRRKKKTLISF